LPSSAKTTPKIAVIDSELAVKFFLEGNATKARQALEDAACRLEGTGDDYAVTREVITANAATVALQTGEAHIAVATLAPLVERWAFLDDSEIQEGFVPALNTLANAYQNTGRADLALKVHERAVAYAKARDGDLSKNPAL